MIRSLFEKLRNDPAQFLNAQKGTEFEDRIEAFLRNKMRYSRLDMKADIADSKILKEEVLKKSNDRTIPNQYGVGSAYIYQPHGTQEYPDFLVFEDREVICIETKYTDKPKPVWNSGLPRPNGFYILGRRTERDITFFRGGDVVSVGESREMHAFFEDLRKQQEQFNKQNMSGQRRGFAVYIRKAFEQKVRYNPEADLDFYASPDRTRLEKNVLDYFL